MKNIKYIVNMELINTYENDCYIACLLAVIRFFQEEQNLFLLNCFGFYYTPKNEDSPSDSEINNYIEEGIEKKLYQHYGIIKKEIKSSLVDNNLLAIKKSINSNNPVLISMDGFYCPWHKAHNIYHVDHYLFLIGFDLKEYKVACFDPFSSQKINYIRIDEMICRIQRLYNFEMIKKRDISHEDYIVSTLTNIIHSNMYSKLIQWKNNINCFCVNLIENNAGNLKSNHVLRSINNIYVSRKNLIFIFYYLQQDNGIIDLKEKLNTIINNWNIVKIRLCHIFKTKKVSEKKLANLKAILDEIIRDEKKLIQMMIKCVGAK